jgi:hypothetical protein
MLWVYAGGYVASKEKLPDVITVCLSPLLTKLCAKVNLYKEIDKYFIKNAVIGR